MSEFKGGFGAGLLAASLLNIILILICAFLVPVVWARVAAIVTW